jgi:plastocyanin
MHSIRIGAAIAMASLLQIGCNAADRSTAPASQDLRVGDVANASRQGDGATVNLLDQCEPTSFNAALGAGTCVGNGTVTFDDFLAELGRHRRVNTWRFAPSTVNMFVGQTLTAMNLGGEEHTFTEVEAFGGGIVQSLNDLAGTPIPAPECLTLEANDRIAPGGSESEVEDDEGTELYQCCIHPWMRAKVHIHKG